MVSPLQQYADYHGQAGSGVSALDPSTWVEIPGQAFKLSASVLASGLNSFYNTGVAVGNWFGADWEENDTYAWLSGMDADLGNYYKENQGIADLGGLIVGSLLPGGVAVKGARALNWGAKALGLAEAGAAGANATLHTGIFGTRIAAYTKEAIDSYKASGTMFSLWNAKFLKSVGTGIAQETLEAGIFEAATAATMFKSPILEDMDFKELVWNGVTGAAFGGVIGGAFKTAQITKSIKKGMDEFDIATNVLKTKDYVGGDIDPATKLAFSLRDIERISSIDAAAIGGNRAVSIQESSLNVARTNVRAFAHEVLVGDKDLANYVGSMFLGNPNTELAQNILGTLSLSRLGDKVDTVAQYQSKVHGLALKENARRTELQGLQQKLAQLESAEIPNEKQLAKVKDKIAKVHEVLEEIDKAFPTRKAWDDEAKTVIDVPRKTSELYIDTHTGAVYGEQPASFGVVDALARKKGETITKAVERKIAEFKFNSASRITADNLDAAELQWKWAEDEFAKGKKIKFSGDPEVDEVFVADANNIPALQALYQNHDFETLLVDYGNGELAQLTRKEVKERIFAEKDALVREFTNKGLSTDKIARALDIDPKAIEGYDGIAYPDEFNSFYRQSLRAKGVNPDMPQYLHAVKDVTFVESPFASDAETVLRSEAKIAQYVRRAASDEVLGEGVTGKLVDARPEMIQEAKRNSGGPGSVTSASGGILDLTSWAQYTGSIFHGARQETKKVVEAAMGTAANLLAANPKSAQAFSLINAKISATTEDYVLGYSRTGEFGIVSRKLNSVLEKAREAKIPLDQVSLKVPLQEGAEEFISFNGDQILETAWVAHVRQTFEEESKISLARTARGEGYHQVTQDSVRPIRPDPRDFNYHAFVVDNTISGAGKVRMITATNAEDLRKLSDGVDRSRFKVIFDKESQDYHKAVKDFDWDLTIHDNYYKAELGQKGTAAPFYPLTDPNAIARNLMDHHFKKADHRLREGLKTHYADVFDELHNLGVSWRQAEESTRKGFGKFGAEKLYNPYESYTKMMLDIPQHEVMPTYIGVSKTVDAAISNLYQKIVDHNPFKDAKSVDEAYQMMSEAGYHTAFNGAAEGVYETINKQVSKGVLSRFIRTVNVVLGNTMLRSDFMNAGNNMIGSVILDSTELKALLRQVANKSPDAGVLAKMSLTTPTGDSIKSAGRLLVEGRTAFHSSDPAIKAFKTQLEDRGILTTLHKVNEALMEDLTFTGAETDGIIAKKLESIRAGASKLMEKAEKWTGNKYAEESNRFTTAYVTKQITDAAIAQGIISEKEAWVIINTQVNRVHGNIVASQRPLLFQGVAGQALGLFQSYQFNLMQQLFRHAGEGSRKDVAMLLGMQTGIYGAHGLPGFSFINEHIVGTRSGNTEHKDIYSATYGNLGKTVGDWLLYGAPSNLTGMAFYTRGDINPRHPTIIPTNPTDLPQWQIPAKALGNLFDTFGRLGDGGDAKAVVLQGLERNAMSRPLAGLGAVLQGFTTTGQGNLSYAGPKEWAFDMTTLTHLGRLSGGKPLQEALVNDAKFRVDTYAAADLEKRKEIGRTFKAGVIGKEMPSQESLQGFMTAYVEAGGKQAGFARWAGQQYRSANEAQANKLVESMKSPGARYLQTIMGGESRPDYWEGKTADLD